MGKSFYEILGIANNARSAEIQQVYRKLVMENHPDRFKDPREKAAAEEKLKDITEAYNTLSNGKLRLDYDKLTTTARAPEKSPQEKAKELFAEATDYYKKGDMKAAQSLFAFIIKSDPENSTAKFFLGMTKLHAPLTRVDGAKEIEAALKLDPYHPAWFLDYAKMLRLFGQELRAGKIVEEGLRANPADYNLEEFLRGPGPKEDKQAGKGGGFSIFGKKP
jgi:curved DNA-binding protein CbpA